MTAFDRATAAEPLGGGRYAVGVDTGWSAPVGPNGGYVAALVLHAMLLALADRPGRAPRSLTAHFLRAPVAGPATVAVTEERSGRSLSTLSARLEQDGRLCVVALGAFAPPYPAAGAYATPAPVVPSPGEIERPPLPDFAPAIAHRLDTRPAFGAPPFSGADEALVGGWLRLLEPRPLDALALVLHCDAWYPAAWPRLHALAPAPTIDLTIHFRATDLPTDPEAFVLGRFTSRTAAEGFFEEDAELWAPDGTLLAQSRQLALLLPMA